jgi:metal transporter CNNM
MYFPMDYLIVFVLLALSALFSGLTLGLMGLNTHTLARQARLGNIYAQKILPLRTKGNQLLTTLILANVLVNTVLSVFLGSIASGIVAVGIATTLIFVLGDILPQAVFARHGLRFGAYWAPYTHALILILSPITYPIGWLLDYFLGEELPTIYSKQELMEIISEHEDSEHSPIDGDEERIVHGALQFSHKKASDVMTPHSQVVTVSAHQTLNTTLRKTVGTEAYSRYPVVSDTSHKVIGILYAKDILLAPQDALVRDVCDTTLLRIKPDTLLDTVLARMLKRQLHMAIVSTDENPLLGVVTLEDIIEEVIQQEILDEDDV